MVGPTIGSAAMCVVSHGHLGLGPRLTSSLVVVSSLDERIDSADSPLSTATLNHQNLASLRLVHTRAVSLTASHTNMLGSLHFARTHPHSPCVSESVLTCGLDTCELVSVAFSKRAERVRARDPTHNTNTQHQQHDNFGHGSGFAFVGADGGSGA